MNTKIILRLTLSALTVLAIFGMFSGSSEPIVAILKDTWIADIAYRLHIGNAIVFDLSVGFLISLFFWFLIVRIPESRKKAILRNNLARQYQHFKEDVIQILLFSSVGSHAAELRKQLCDHNEFKRFFSENEREKWYAALNGLQGNEGYLNDLIVEIELLANEISYVLNNINIDDDEVHSFFKRLSTHVYKLRRCTVYTYDHVKYLGNFIWEILARWSIIDGQRKEDIVQEMIDRI
jgi:hypothetical protein